MKSSILILAAVLFCYMISNGIAFIGYSARAFRTSYSIFSLPFILVLIQPGNVFCADTNNTETREGMQSFPASYKPRDTAIVKHSAHG